MATQKKLGPISTQARRDYRARLGSDLKWKRPTADTAAKVWVLLAPPVQIESLMPKRRFPNEEAASVAIGKQSLLVAVDCAVAAGDQRKMLTFNRLFDALAKRWSHHFKGAALDGAYTAYDMREDTVKGAWRDLLFAGIRIDTLWKLVTGTWSQGDGGNPLYSVRLVSGRGHARGRGVLARPDGSTRRAYDALVLADPYYRRPQQRRILFDEDRMPARRVRQAVCAQRPHNVVNLGEDSARVLAYLEEARVRFNVEVFRQDYEVLAEYLDTAPYPCTRVQREGYRKLEAFVNGHRGVYFQTAGIPLETVPGDEFDESPRPLSGFRLIKSRFFRALNRRYHATHFWPEHVSEEFRRRWFGVETAAPQLEVGGVFDPPEFIDGTPSGQFVERDISSSQTQILAVFLGLTALESLTRTQKFKVYLARELWAQHAGAKGPILAEGYTGEDDSRLVDFIKAHWMRLLYGGKVSRLVRELGKEPAKYGPGWLTTRGLWARATDDTPSGTEEAARRARAFLASLPSWYGDLETFLAACRHLGKVDGKRDPYRGVVFEDPFDGVEVRWNPAKRAVRKVQSDTYKIEVRLPGKLVKKKFESLPVGTIDRRELGQLIPPCVVHMLDAFFSSLIIEDLHANGVRDVVAVHDGWFVPEAVRLEEDGDDVNSGGMALDWAIREAGQEWLEGLGPVYQAFVSYLGNHKRFGKHVQRWHTDWSARVRARNWPRFNAGEPFMTPIGDSGADLRNLM